MVPMRQVRAPVGARGIAQATETGGSLYGCCIRAIAKRHRRGDTGAEGWTGACNRRRGLMTVSSIAGEDITRNMAVPDTAEPQAVFRDDSGTLAVALAGSWSADRAPRVESLAAEIGERVAKANRARLDLSSVERLDTLGAYVLNRVKHERESGGASVEIVSRRPEHGVLLSEVTVHDREADHAGPPFRVVDVLVRIGAAVIRFGRDMVAGSMFLGEVVVGSASVVVGPRKFRGPSMVNQIELIAFNGAPIIMLISFLVGCIVAQQGIFQLQQFGATAFVVNLTGILILRELAVLLTSIMIAGRSGSAITAEIGSMKMREEIDALRVMGLDPDLHLGHVRPDRRRPGLLALRRHRHRHLPGATAVGHHLEAFRGRAGEGALHGLRHRADRLDGGAGREGLGGVARPSGHGFGGQGDLHGDRRGRAFRHVLFIHRVLRTVSRR